MRFCFARLLAWIAIRIEPSVHYRYLKLQTSDWLGTWLCTSTAFCNHTSSSARHKANTKNKRSAIQGDLPCGVRSWAHLQRARYVPCCAFNPTSRWWSHTLPNLALNPSSKRSNAIPSSSSHKYLVHLYLDMQHDINFPKGQNVGLSWQTGKSSLSSRTPGTRLRHSCREILIFTTTAPRPSSI